MELMNFPKSEWKSVSERLDKMGFAYTTRVSKERDKYCVNDVYKTPWGDTIKVTKIKSLKDVNEHPFLNDLNQRQRKTLSRYQGMNLIRFEKITSGCGREA